jgi:hypothetical protein
LGRVQRDSMRRKNGSIRKVDCPRQMAFSALATTVH